MRARLVTAATSLGLAVLSARLHRRRRVLLVAVEAQIRAEDVLEREAAPLALFLQVGLDLLALLGLAQRLDAEGDLAVAGVDGRHLGLDFLPGLEQRLRL